MIKSHVSRPPSYLRQAVSFIALSIVCTLTSAASAADISVLTPPNMKAILADIAPQFQQATGHTFTVSYAPADAVKKKILAGDAADVAITLKPLAGELAKTQIVAASSTWTLVYRLSGPQKCAEARHQFVEAFKRSLLAAHSIAYSDPPKGGISGVYFSRLIERMGLADAMRSKTKLVQPGGGPLVAAVSSGEAEIGVDQLSSLVGKPLQVVVALPSEFGVDIVMSACVVAGAKQATLRRPS